MTVVLEIATAKPPAGAADISGDLIAGGARLQHDAKFGGALLGINVADCDDVLPAEIAIRDGLGAVRCDLPDRDDVLAVVAGKG